MKSYSILISLFFTLFINLDLVHAQQSGLTTFILVRHAEKSTNHPNDPDLSPIGFERADELAQILIHTPIDVALSTDYKRTRQTLAPLVQAKDLKIIEYDPNNNKTLRNLIKTYRGKTIILSGHSNTTPKLVNQLASTEFEQLDESEYDKIFIVTLKKIGKGKVLILSY